jgi:hypothetical protein
VEKKRKQSRQSGRRVGDMERWRDREIERWRDGGVKRVERCTALHCT